MLSFEGVTVTFEGRAAVDGVTLDVPGGATTVLLGPSGCGKSTMLRCAIGLVVPQRGRVVVAGTAITGNAARRLRHRIGYVIQEGGLFPHLTARENVTLLAEDLGRGDVDARVAELARLVRLPKDRLSRRPGRLSGGERQRVGLMRALFLDPEVLLLDEPLGALDPITRDGLQQELAALFETLPCTTLLVTHDVREAEVLAHRLAVMNDGRILREGTWEEVVADPADEFVDRFLRIGLGSRSE